MAIGPLQFVFLGVRTDEQRAEVGKRLRAAADRGTIRVIDIAYATKREDGTFTPVTEQSSMTDEEKKQLGATVGALLGMGFGGYYGGKEGAKEGAKAGAQIGAQGGTGTVAAFAQEEFGESVDDVREHLREVAADLPVGATCGVALIEHRWMVDLRDQLLKNGVVILGSGLIRPRSLVMFGADMAGLQQASAS
ncbi:MAG: hypothetical protein ACLQUY_10045 [Ktedonobacterales bacterium]